MKYRHHGYRDDDYKRERERDHETQKRGPREITTREATVVLRCWQCGTEQDTEELVAALAACSNCRADLRCCRNCMQFDPGARFQCRKPIEKAYRDKTARNDCAVFEPRQVLDSTGRRSAATAQRVNKTSDKDRADDPRDAFAKLFK